MLGLLVPGLGMGGGGGEVVAIVGPCVVAAQAYLPGACAAEAYLPGVKAAEEYLPGCKAAETAC